MCAHLAPQEAATQQTDLPLAIFSFGEVVGNILRPRSLLKTCRGSADLFRARLSGHAWRRNLKPRPRKGRENRKANRRPRPGTLDEPAIELLNKLSDGADGFTHGLAALSSVSVRQLSHTVPVA